MTNSAQNLNNGIPEWYKDVPRNFYAILALDANWDSYGANKISPKTVIAADELLGEIMKPDSPPPQIVPCANGNIQLEWHTGGIDLEIEVESMSVSHVFFGDKRNEEPEWEGEISHDLARLVRYINLLTERAR